MATKKKAGKATVRFAMRLPQELDHRIKRAARERGMTASTLVRSTMMEATK